MFTIIKTQNATFHLRNAKEDALKDFPLLFYRQKNKDALIFL
jgi:hypothetical protein